MWEDVAQAEALEATWAELAGGVVGGSCGGGGGVISEGFLGAGWSLLEGSGGCLPLCWFKQLLVDRYPRIGTNHDISQEWPLGM